MVCHSLTKINNCWNFVQAFAGLVLVHLLPESAPVKKTRVLVRVLRFPLPKAITVENFQAFAGLVLVHLLPESAPVRKHIVNKKPLFGVLWPPVQCCLCQPSSDRHAISVCKTQKRFSIKQ